MNAEEKAERKEQMSKCLEIATDIWDLLASAEESGEREVHINKVKEVISTKFAAPLHKSRLDAVGYSVAAALNSYDLTSCGLWAFAHNLDHCLFEDDLAEIEQALSVMR